MLPIVEDPRLESHLDYLEEGQSELLMIEQGPDHLSTLDGLILAQNQALEDRGINRLIVAAWRGWQDLSFIQKDAATKGEIRFELIRADVRGGKYSIRSVWRMQDQLISGEDPLERIDSVVTLPMGEFRLRHYRVARELLDLCEPELVGYLDTVRTLEDTIPSYSLLVWPDYLEIPTDSCTMRELCQRAHSYKLVYKRASSHLDGDSRKLILEGRP